MKSLKNFSYCLLLTISFNSKAQVKYSISLPEYDYIFTPHGKCRDTIFESIGKERFIKVFLFECKGRMNIEVYSKDSVILEKGSYVNSLDLLKSYYYAAAASKHSTKIKVNSYYQPLRNGVWHFFDETGKLWLNRIYDKGIVVDSLLAKY